MMNGITPQMQELYEAAKAKLDAAEAERQANLEAMRIEFAPKNGEEFDENVRGDRIAKRGWAAWHAEVCRKIRPEDYCTAEECEAYHEVTDRQFDELFANFFDGAEEE